MCTRDKLRHCLSQVGLEDTRPVLRQSSLSRTYRWHVLVAAELRAERVSSSLK